MGNYHNHKSESVFCPSEKKSLKVEEPECTMVSVQSSVAHPATSECPVIRQLILHCSEKLDDVIYLVTKGWIVRFILGPSLVNLNVRLFIYCQTAAIDEERGQCELVWHKQHFPEVASFSDNVQIFADIQATKTGSFGYFFTVDGTSQQEGASGSGYFIVQPELKVGRLKTNVPLHGIVCQTLLSKNMGPFSGWLECLVVAKNTGYNAVHFTPLQVSDYYYYTMSGKKWDQ